MLSGHRHGALLDATERTGVTVGLPCALLFNFSVSPRSQGTRFEFKELLLRQYIVQKEYLIENTRKRHLQTLIE